MARATTISRIVIDQLAVEERPLFETEGFQSKVSWRLHSLIVYPLENGYVVPRVTVKAQRLNAYNTWEHESVVAFNHIPQNAQAIILQLLVKHVPMFNHINED